MSNNIIYKVLPLINMLVVIIGWFIYGFSGFTNESTQLLFGVFSALLVFVISYITKYIMKLKSGIHTLSLIMGLIYVIWMVVNVLVTLF